MLLPLFDAKPPPEPAADQPEYQRLSAEMIGHLEACLAAPDVDKILDSAVCSFDFLDRFNAFLRTYDQLIDFVLRHEGSDQTIQCTRGCSNCCIDLVRGVFTVEILNLYNHARRMPQMREWFDRHSAAADRFNDILENKLSSGEVGFSPDDERMVEAHMDFNRQNVPCGFQDTETGLCSIYPVRPIACRYFFSFDPPDMCTPEHKDYFRRRTRTVFLPQRVNELLVAIDQKLGFRPVNYLSGAFCEFTSEVMKSRPLRVLRNLPG